MSEFIFVKGYREQHKLRKSFNELAKLVFGIQFESWYEKGYWTDKYIPFSYTDRNQIVANVSVNIIDLVVEGKIKRAIQIGTVMTHPDYRGLGLSRKLMNKVLEEYSGKCDIMYLFANDTVLDFYPKFGFEALDETVFSIRYPSSQKNSKASVRKLSGESDEDLQFIYNFSQKRVPVSRVFGTIHTEELLQFYCIVAFPNNIYFLVDEEIIVLYQENNEHELHIYDVVSQKEVNLEKVVNSITTEHTKNVIFHFTVDNHDRLPLETKKNNNGLFVRKEGEFLLPVQFKHPITSQA